MANHRIARKGIQLAHPAEEKRIQALGPKFLCQPKLNGERCRVEWFHGEPVLLSSYGNIFPFLEHIKQDLIDLNYHIPFDGEIYVHTWPRERIDSALRTRKQKHPENDLLELHIFDIVSELPQGRRILQLQNIPFGGSLHRVSYDILNPPDWIPILQTYIDEGYEGIILRDINTPYTDCGTTNRRCKGMLKFKPSEKDTYRIVGYKEGTGWAEGMLGAFIVASVEETDKIYNLQDLDSLPDSLTIFAVGTGPELTKENRIKYWKIRNDLIGKTLTVKHEKLKTSGGIPVCTVAYKLNI